MSRFALVKKTTVGEMSWAGELGPGDKQQDVVGVWLSAKLQAYAHTPDMGGG